MGIDIHEMVRILLELLEKQLKLFILVLDEDALLVVLQQAHFLVCNHDILENVAVSRLELVFTSQLPDNLG